MSFCEFAYRCYSTSGDREKVRMQGFSCGVDMVGLLSSVMEPTSSEMGLLRIAKH